MNTEIGDPTNMKSGSASNRGELNLETIKRWMKEEVSFRFAKGWLVAGAVVLLLLLIAALD